MTTTGDFQKRLDGAREASARLKEAIGQVIVGQGEVVEQALWGLVAGGHVLLEGAPGLGKTLLVRTIASCLDLKFSRIQFTPDLMPSDVTGTNILVTSADGSRHFALHKGPIFGQVVLADEINRATPKTQSSLLEAMQEHACTIGGVRHAMEEPFFVLATENPIEMEGTYPLPEAQLDRFLLKVIVPSPTEDEMTEILTRTTGQPKDAPPRVLDRDEVLAVRSACRDVAVAEPIMRFASRLVRASDPATQGAPDLVKRAIRYGAGVRGGQSLVLAAKAVSVLEGRAHVSFGDVQRVAKPVLRHRLIRSFEGEADGITTDQVVDALIASVPARPENVEQAIRR
ncbi:AAA family ATPase [Polyangium sorediatum]|uniref:AAA family ATPase n=1 Tax=Polyangium sorediatum TaxID=889274 RepID=A0ABT6P5U3_9BACT|nr:AAA family ATPase [Polyangium sorediatum]MDI1435938.1 AAA family ATPase [Polyangium sorediatum]